MKKEIVLVAVIGIFLGLIISFGIWRIAATNNKPANPQPTSSPLSTSEFKIVLDKPENGDVVVESMITVSGITKPLVFMTISGEDEDYITQSDERGFFSQEVNLNGGVNQIKINAFDPQGNQSIEKVLVVYSSSFQINEASETAKEESATDEASVKETNTNDKDESIRQKVAQKVAEALNKPKAYLGTVTDIADSTVQIKTIDSQIKQISTSKSDLTVVNTTGTVSKTVKLTDIAIGDFIVAMGYINGKSVLLAQRILVTNPAVDPEIDSVYAKVTNVTKKDFEASNILSKDTKTLTPNKDTDFFTFKDKKTVKAKLLDLSEEDLIIYVITKKEAIRSVFILQNS